MSYAAFIATKQLTGKWDLETAANIWVPRRIINYQADANIAMLHQGGAGGSGFLSNPVATPATVASGVGLDRNLAWRKTTNMELVLNRRLAEKRIYPAIDIGMSGTRREELILPPEYMKAATRFRRYLANLTEMNQMPAAIQALEKYKTMPEFIQAFV